MENRGNVGMPQAGRCPCLTQKTQACRFIVKVLLADYLERDRATKIAVESFVRNTHRPATQLNRPALFVRLELMVIKFVICLNRGLGTGNRWFLIDGRIEGKTKQVDETTACVKRSGSRRSTGWTLFV